MSMNLKRVMIELSIPDVETILRIEMDDDPAQRKSTRCTRRGWTPMRQRGAGWRTGSGGKNIWEAVLRLNILSPVTMHQYR